MCEIAGQGPIPVADVWRMIDGDAFVATVTTNGTEIDKVVHLGRKPTVLQKTALEWFSAGECSTEGCTNPARIEIDHVADWADTKITRLPDLASPCGHYHDLKTHRGYTFGPRLPSGKRRLIPPDGADPPGRDRSVGRRAPTRAPATNPASSTPADRGQPTASMSTARAVAWASLNGAPMIWIWSAWNDACWIVGAEITTPSITMASCRWGRSRPWRSSAQRRR